MLIASNFFTDNYAPPPPPNWPEALRMASVGLPPTAIGLPLRKSKKVLIIT